MKVKRIYNITQKGKTSISKKQQKWKKKAKSKLPPPSALPLSYQNSTPQSVGSS